MSLKHRFPREVKEYYKDAYEKAKSQDGCDISLQEFIVQKREEIISIIPDFLDTSTQEVDWVSLVEELRKKGMISKSFPLSTLQKLVQYAAGNTHKLENALDFPKNSLIQNPDILSTAIPQTTHLITSQADNRLSFVSEWISNAIDASSPHKQIGRFGEGFFQSLKELSDPASKITVSSKQKDTDGYTLGLKKKKDEIYVDTQTNNNATQGTKVTLQKKLSQKDTGEIQDYINRKFRTNTRAIIYVNGERVNNFGEYHYLNGTPHVENNLPEVHIEILRNSISVQDSGVGMSAENIAGKLLYPNTTTKERKKMSDDEVCELSPSETRFFYKKKSSKKQKTQILLQVAGVIIEEFFVESSGNIGECVFEFPSFSPLEDSRNEIKNGRETTISLTSALEKIAKNTDDTHEKLALLEVISAIYGRVKDRPSNVVDEKFTLTSNMKKTFQNIRSDIESDGIRVLPGNSKIIDSLGVRDDIFYIAPEFIDFDPSSIPGIKEITGSVVNPAKYSHGDSYRFFEAGFDSDCEHDYLIHEGAVILNSKILANNTDSRDVVISSLNVSINLNNGYELEDEKVFYGRLPTSSEGKIVPKTPKQGEEKIQKPRGRVVRESGINQETQEELDELFDSQFKYIQQEARSFLKKYISKINHGKVGEINGGQKEKFNEEGKRKIRNILDTGIDIDDCLLLLKYERLFQLNLKHYDLASGESSNRKYIYDIVNNVIAFLDSKNSSITIPTIAFLKDMYMQLDVIGNSHNAQLALKYTKILFKILEKEPNYILEIMERFGNTMESGGRKHPGYEIFGNLLEAKLHGKKKKESKEDTNTNSVDTIALIEVLKNIYDKTRGTVFFLEMKELIENLGTLEQNMLQSIKNCILEYSSTSIDTHGDDWQEDDPDIRRDLKLILGADYHRLGFNMSRITVLQVIFEKEVETLEKIEIEKKWGKYYPESFLHEPYFEECKKFFDPPFIEIADNIRNRLITVSESENNPNAWILEYRKKVLFLSALQKEIGDGSHNKNYLLAVRDLVERDIKNERLAVQVSDLELYFRIEGVTDEEKSWEYFDELFEAHKQELGISEEDMTKWMKYYPESFINDKHFLAYLHRGQYKMESSVKHVRNSILNYIGKENIPEKERATFILNIRDKVLLYTHLKQNKDELEKHHPLGLIETIQKEIANELHGMFPHLLLIMDQMMCYFLEEVRTQKDPMRIDFKNLIEEFKEKLGFTDTSSEKENLSEELDAKWQRYFKGSWVNEDFFNTSIHTTGLGPDRIDRIKSIKRDFETLLQNNHIDAINTILRLRKIVTLYYHIGDTYRSDKNYYILRKKIEDEVSSYDLGDISILRLYFYLEVTPGEELDDGGYYDDTIKEYGFKIVDNMVVSLGENGEDDGVYKLDTNYLNDILEDHYHSNPRLSDLGSLISRLGEVEEEKALKFRKYILENDTHDFSEIFAILGNTEFGLFYSFYLNGDEHGVRFRKVNYILKEIFEYELENPQSDNKLASEWKEYTKYGYIFGHYPGYMHVGEELKKLYKKRKVAENDILDFRNFTILYHNITELKNHDNTGPHISGDMLRDAFNKYTHGLFGDLVGDFGMFEFFESEYDDVHGEGRFTKFIQAKDYTGFLEKIGLSHQSKSPENKVESHSLSGTLSPEREWKEYKNYCAAYKNFVPLIDSLENKEDTSHLENKVWKITNIFAKIHGNDPEKHFRDIIIPMRKKAVLYYVLSNIEFHIHEGKHMIERLLTDNPFTKKLYDSFGGDRKNMQDTMYKIDRDIREFFLEDIYTMGFYKRDELEDDDVEYSASEMYSYFEREYDFSHDEEAFIDVFTTLDYTTELEHYGIIKREKKLTGELGEVPEGFFESLSERYDEDIIALVQFLESNGDFLAPEESAVDILSPSINTSLSQLIHTSMKHQNKIAAGVDAQEFGSLLLESQKRGTHYNDIISGVCIAQDEVSMYYLREGVQNARDAILKANNGEGSNISINTYSRDGYFTTSMNDTVGMELSDVIIKLLTPYNSGKDGIGSTGKFGKGFFTFAVGCKELRIKTSSGNGTVSYLKLTPQVKDGIIYDFETEIEQREEDFKGTTIERVDELSGIPGNLRALIGTNLLKKYVGNVEGVDIHYNDNKINKSKNKVLLREVEIFESPEKYEDGYERTPFNDHSFKGQKEFYKYDALWKKQFGNNYRDNSDRYNLIHDGSGNIIGLEPLEKQKDIGIPIEQLRIHLNPNMAEVIRELFEKEYGNLDGYNIVLNKDNTPIKLISPEEKIELSSGPSLGTLRVFKSSDNIERFTKDNLWISEIKDDLLSDFPDWIIAYIRKQKLSIDIPEQTPLVGSRNSIENKEYYMDLIKPKFYRMIIDIILSGHVGGSLKIPMMPEDYLTLLSYNARGSRDIQVLAEKYNSSPNYELTQSEIELLKDSAGMAQFLTHIQFYHNGKNTSLESIKKKIHDDTQDMQEYTGRFRSQTFVAQREKESMNATPEKFNLSYEEIEEISGLRKQEIQKFEDFIQATFQGVIDKNYGGKFHVSFHRNSEGGEIANSYGGAGYGLSFRVDCEEFRMYVTGINKPEIRERIIHTIAHEMTHNEEDKLGTRKWGTHETDETHDESFIKMNRGILTQLIRSLV